MFTYLYFVYIYTHIHICVYTHISLIVYSEIGISRKKIASVIRSLNLYKLEIKKESVQLLSLTHSGYYK